MRESEHSRLRLSSIKKKENQTNPLKGTYTELLQLNNESILHLEPVFQKHPDIFCH